MKGKELATIRMMYLKAIKTAKAEAYSVKEGYWRGFADGLKYADCVLSGERLKDEDFLGVRV